MISESRFVVALPGAGARDLTTRPKKKANVIITGTGGRMKSFISGIRSDAAYVSAPALPGSGTG